MSLINAHEVKLPKNIDELSLTRINPSIYVVYGIQTLPDQNNKGFISNTGIVLDENGVIIVDGGGSLKVGQLIVAKLQDITNQPVKAIINTHIHGDHWLGNAAFLEAFPETPIYAHERAIKRLNNGEAERWTDIFRRMTDTEINASDVALPTIGLKGGETLKVGETELKIHHTGHAHTDSDVMIEIPEHSVLFAGDIIEYGRAVSSDVPADFNAQGQMKAIRYAMALPVDTFVPGHGVSGGRKIPQASLQFLDILYKSVKRNYEAGLQDYEMRNNVAKDLSEFSHWFGFDQLGVLISYIYQQIELADFQ